ncbi:MAG: hypothetical protein QOE36_2666 [Gaiellaceae bacterium]|nr:hypothetical protein [Gaiellaceae bacterium]
MRVRPEARGALAAFLAFGAFWGGWAVLVPSVQTAVGASKGQLGLALLGIGLGSIPAMTLVRRFVDRGLHLILPVSFVALAGAALLPAIVGSVAMLGAVLFVLGAFSGVLDVAINADIAAIEADTGTRLMQLAHAFFSIGVILGAAIAGIMRQAGAGRLPVLAALSGCLLAAGLLNRNPPRRVPADSLRARPRLRRAFVFLGVACAGAFIVESGIENWSALFLERELHTSPGASALGPGFYAAAMATGRLSGQKLTGRVSDALLLGGGALISVVGLLVAAAAHSLPLVVAGFFVGGIGVSVAAPITFSAAGRGAPEHERASAVATITTVGYLGFLVGPPIVGGIAQAVGLRLSFVALAGVATLLAIATPRLALTPAPS